jgi:hypothetical protein
MNDITVEQLAHLYSNLIERMNRLERVIAYHPGMRRSDGDGQDIHDILTAAIEAIGRCADHHAKEGRDASS